MAKVEFPLRIDEIDGRWIYSSPDLMRDFTIPNGELELDHDSYLVEAIKNHLIECMTQKIKLKSPLPISEYIKNGSTAHRWKIISIEEDRIEKNNFSLCRYLFPASGLAANTVAGMTQSTIEFFSLQNFFRDPTLAFTVGFIGALVNLIAFSADYLATDSLKDLRKIGNHVDRRIAEKLQDLRLIKREKDLEVCPIQFGTHRNGLFSCVTLCRKRNLSISLLSLAFMLFVSMNACFEGGTAYQEVYSLGNLSRQRGAKSLNRNGLILVAALTGIVMLLRTLAFELSLQLTLVKRLEARSIKKDKSCEGNNEELKPLIEKRNPGIN